MASKPAFPSYQAVTGGVLVNRLLFSGLILNLLGLVTVIKLVPRTNGLISFIEGEPAFEDVPAPVFTGALESSLHKFEFGKIHMLSAGDPEAKVHVFAVHGKNATTQNAMHWRKMTGMLQTMGTFHLIDLPGFGESETARNLQSIPPQISQIAVSEAVRVSGVLEKKGTKIVLLARSWGAEVVMKALLRDRELAKRVYRVILISPTPRIRTLPQNADRIKGAILWAERDPIAPPGYRRAVKKSLRSMTEFVVPNLMSHEPEVTAPGVVSRTIMQWWRSHRP